MKFKSIQTQIALSAGICLFATVAILVIYNVYSASSNQKLVSEKVSTLVKSITINQLQATASDYAKSISQRLGEGLNAASTLAEAAAASKTYEQTNQKVILNRPIFNGMLVNVLKNNTDLNGVYSCWAPNAFDQEDAQHQDGQQGNNAQTGRFTPYWVREKSGNMSVQPLVEYDSTDTHPNGIMKGAWYQGPKQTHHETVTAPLPYIVQGKNVWLATLSAPIMVNGQFQGSSEQTITSILSNNSVKKFRQNFIMVKHRCLLLPVMG
ncbi:cache domain-containing protein [Vibrio sp. PP-XX7]